MSNETATVKAFQDWSTMASDPSVGRVVVEVVGDAIRKGDIASAQFESAPVPVIEPSAAPRPRAP